MQRLCLWALMMGVAAGGAAAQDASVSPSDIAATPALPPSDAPPGLAPTPSSPTLGAPSGTHAADLVPDMANSTKFYTITASLREEYDDNIYTTKDDPKASAVTEFSPSVLVHFSSNSSNFSARYTFGLDYYEARNGNPIDMTHEYLFNFTHQFTDRFSLTLADQGGYFNEPDLLNSVGTPFRSGSYFENTLNAGFDAQWTPLFGTSTNYSNVAILYDNDQISRFQNYDENTLSNDFRFAVYPKYNLTAGFIVDNLDYFYISRGYTNSTLDVGVDWQTLPDLTVAVRGGGSLTVGNGVGNSVSPYGSASVDWRLGKRSDLTVDYTHTVQPTDVSTAVGQEVDRFSVRFSYDITASTTAHLAGTYTHSTYTEQLLRSGGSFTEEDIGLDLGLSYRFNPVFSVEGGYYLSDISSEQDERDYTRNQVYLGVRGTY